MRAPVAAPADTTAAAAAEHVTKLQLSSRRELSRWAAARNLA